MSEDQFNKNSEYETEFESEYEDSENDSECADSDSDSDYDNENNIKRRKFEDDAVTEELSTDENGHVECHPGQQLGQYEIKSVLGEGAFGRVLRVKNLKTGRNEAMKVLKNEQTKRKAAMAEIIALTVISCRDPLDTSNCIKMLNWFSYDGHVCITFPQLGVSVFDYLKDNDFQPFTIHEVRHISHQLLCAVSFLHKNGMTHTDLKPENMLFLNSSFTTVLDEETNLEWRRLNSTEIRLIDFGNVTRDNEHHHTIISTRYYRAPEVILKLDWTHSCDMWSIGCVLIELYFGDLLFPTDDDREHLGMMEQILGQIPVHMIKATRTDLFKNGTLDYNWNEAAEDTKGHCRPLQEFQLANCDDEQQLFRVIEQMLEYDPSKRLTSSAALVQPFFENLPSHQRVTK